MWKTYSHLQVPKQLLSMGRELQKWAFQRRSENKNRVNCLNRRFELYNVEPDNDTLEDIIEVKLALNLEIDKEEMHLEQRARANWLK